jgi:hypothetical protein
VFEPDINSLLHACIIPMLQTDYTCNPIASVLQLFKSCILKSTINNGLTQSHTVLTNIPTLQDCSRFPRLWRALKFPGKTWAVSGFGTCGDF